MMACDVSPVAMFEGKNRLDQVFDCAAVAEHLEYGLQEHQAVLTTFSLK